MLQGRCCPQTCLVAVHAAQLATTARCDSRHLWLSVVVGAPGAVCALAAQLNSLSDVPLGRAGRSEPHLSCPALFGKLPTVAVVLLVVGGLLLLCGRHGCVEAHVTNSSLGERAAAAGWRQRRGHCKHCHTCRGTSTFMAPFHCLAISSVPSPRRQRSTAARRVAPRRGEVRRTITIEADSLQCSQLNSDETLMSGNPSMAGQQKQRPQLAAYVSPKRMGTHLAALIVTGQKTGGRGMPSAADRRGSCRSCQMQNRTESAVCA